MLVSGVPSCHLHVPCSSVRPIQNPLHWSDLECTCSSLITLLIDNWKHEKRKKIWRSTVKSKTFYISRPSKRRMIIQYRWCAAYWIFPPALLCYLWRPGQLHVFYSVPWHHAMISVSLCWRKESSNTWSSDESTLPCSVYSFHLLENKMATITTFICWFWSDPFALHVIKAGIFK